MIADEDDALMEVGQRIQESSGTLLALLDGLESLNDIRSAPSDESVLILSAIESAASTLSDRDGTELHLSLHGERDLTTRCDPGLLISVFLNLFQNSVKFHESQDCEVSVTIAGEGDTAVVDVQDNGPGLVPKGKNVFAPFVRLSNATNRVGSGLGLTMVDRIARTYGGEALSMPCDKGAHFQLRFVCLEAS